MFDVGAEDFLEIGHLQRFTHRNREFVVARIGDGSYHAVRASCPHQGVDLGEGHLVGRNLPSAVGHIEHVADNSVLRCPRHGWSYDMRDGCSRFDERARIKSYRVVVQDGRVLVDI